jgi:hypothetical protein
VATEVDLTIEAGSQFVLTLFYCNQLPGSVPPAPDPSNPVNVLNWSARMQIRAGYRDGKLLCDLTDGNGITVGGSDGEFLVVITPEQTRALANGVYDLIATPPSPSTNTQRIAQGKVVVSPVATLAIS